MCNENKEEKFVREYFEGMDYSSQKLDLDKSKRLPDYLFEKADLKFVAEVKNIEEQKEIANAILVLNKIGEIVKDLDLSYSLRFSIEKQILIQEIKKREMVNLLMRELSNSSVDIGYKFSYKSKIVFEVKSQVLANQKPDHDGGYSPDELTYHKNIIDDIKDAVRKYKQYGRNLPYVLILFPNRSLYSDAGLYKAMFGEGKDGLRINSALQRYKNTSLSAIAVYESNHFKVYHNPHRSIEFPYEIFNYDNNIQFSFNTEKSR